MSINVFADRVTQAEKSDRARRDEVFAALVSEFADGADPADAETRLAVSGRTLAALTQAVSEEEGRREYAAAQAVVQARLDRLAELEADAKQVLADFETVVAQWKAKVDYANRVIAMTRHAKQAGCNSDVLAFLREIDG